MGELFRRGAAAIFVGLVGVATLVSPGAMAQGEPPARVGRLAFTEGTVSFHDAEQSGWTQAVVNTPLTTGDSLWTEPNARSEISLAGTRIRMDSATQLDMLALDDRQTRLQLTQGRIDLKTVAMEANQPYEIVTPRGTIALQQQGDYYVEAGSTEDPTRLGVRSGVAQIQSLNGQVLAVRPGEVAEVAGDAAAPQLRTVKTAPPAAPAYWASRDRQVVYDLPQYLSAGVTGYEDLNAYGSWTNDGSYGEVWVPRAAPSGWAPYRTGHWSYVQPWGWTWIDEQPWGFAPYHYGRWANRNNRWMWVPPQREIRPVYAPALVAFMGGVELAAALSNHSSAPVGWFPLGPREVYVPSYTTNRDYYQRINGSAHIEDRILEDRWQRAERHEAFVPGPNQALMNQRFATVVPTAAFVRSQPVMRAALQVPPQAIASAPVAPVAAPPAPTASFVSAAGAPARQLNATPAPQQATPITPNVPLAKTAVADMPTLAKPAATPMPAAAAAPGPKVAATQPNAAIEDKSKQTMPTLVPRQGAAPPVLKGAVTPVPAQPARPGEPARQQQAAPQPQAVPPAAPAPAPAPAPQARPDLAKPNEPAKPQASPPPPPPPLPAPQQAKPAEPAKPPQAAPVHAPPPPQQARPEPPKQQPQAAPPPPVRTAPSPQQQEGHAQPVAPVAPRPQPAPQPQAVPVQHQAPQPAPQPQAAPVQHQAPPPQPAPQQRQAAPAPQPQAAPPQHQAPPPPQPRPPEQAQSHPAPQQQPHPAPQAKPDDKK